MHSGGKPQTTGFILFDGVTPLDIAGPLEVFGKARSGQQKGQPFHRVVIIGVSGKKVAAESGLIFTADTMLADAPPVDTVVLPGGNGIERGKTYEAIKSWLMTRVQVTRRIISISGGIYPLAATGLLANRAVTTHWRYTRDLACRFPELRVSYSASFIKDGQFYSCGTSTGAIELALSIIEEDYGRTEALAVAKELVMHLRPAVEADADALEFVDEPDYMDRLDDLPAWIASHLHENLSVEALATRACLCPRHFSRVFKSKFGQTPGAFVENLRLSEARRRLLSSRNGLESVAHSVGFKSADSFRRAFERRFDIAPSQFRRQARSMGCGQRVSQGKSLVEKSAPLPPSAIPLTGCHFDQPATAMTNPLPQTGRHTTGNALI